MKTKWLLLLLLFHFGMIVVAQQKKDVVVANENLITENIPDIPKTLASTVKKYAESRSASLNDVHPLKDEIIISTRFGATSQFHMVTQPMGARTQLTFFDEPVTAASYEPLKGDYLIYSRDVGGNEFGQLFKLDLKTLQSTLLTDGGRSQNGGVTWRNDGNGFFFASTKRNGGDRDIYYMDPNNPSAQKLILEVKGGGWGIADIAKDDKSLLISEYVSANESHIWSLDIATGKLTSVTDRKSKSIVQAGASFSNDANEIWF